MNTIASPLSYTAFEGHRILAAGPLADVALAVKRAMNASDRETVLVFQDGTGQQTDLDPVSYTHLTLPTILLV